MATEAQSAFARNIYTAAQKATDIAPEFVTAQAILESDWGKSRVGKYNLFGITKGSNWTGKTVLILTHEYFNTPGRTFTAPERVVSVCKCKTGNRWYYNVYRLFKDFDSLADCLKEHTRHNAEEFARLICDNKGSKYATSPDYLRQMLLLISTVRKLVK